MTNKDEKIRKFLVEMIGFVPEHSIDFSGEIKKEDVLAWLEKQGEYKQDTNYPKFDFNDVLALECCMETAEKVQKDEALYEKLKDLYSKVHDAYQKEYYHCNIV